MRNKAGIIINPVSGTLDKAKLEQEIKEGLSATYDVQVCYTRYPGHGNKIARDLVNEGFQTIIVVGGDGTINEIGSAMVNTNVCLGIVPAGSGNGLARHLKIPLKSLEAIRVLKEGRIAEIDYGIFNGHIFFCTAGLGFDALISQKFEEMPKRGFSSYFKAVIHHFFSYKAKKYLIKIDDVKYKRKAFLITIANASQYGNNAFIAPNANITDGLFDVAILSPFPRRRVVELGLKLMNKRIESSEFVEIVKGSKVILKRNKKGPVHIDGEPLKMGKKIKAEIVHKGLKVIVPRTDN
ncbi:MAG: diacylglycerol kinase family lipid kinase [Bacteroidales bacterium]|nr:diacylglycerol kinase family lipid kinase [Bacteroidales bacterium]